jgi:hypothetical protein
MQRIENLQELLLLDTLILSHNWISSTVKVLLVHVTHIEKQHFFFLLLSADTDC